MKNIGQLTINTSCTRCGWKQSVPLPFSPNYLWTFHVAKWLANRVYDIHAIRCSIRIVKKERSNG